MTKINEFRELLDAARTKAVGSSNDEEIDALWEAVTAAEDLINDLTPVHEFTGTVKRADGITVTATLTVPHGHPAVSPEPLRPWHGTDRTNHNFLELGELAMMMAQQGYGIMERNERARESWGKRDYWTDLLNIDAPTPELEAGE